METVLHVSALNFWVYSSLKKKPLTVSLHLVTAKYATVELALISGLDWRTKPAPVPPLIAKLPRLRESPYNSSQLLLLGIEKHQVMPGNVWEKKHRACVNYKTGKEWKYYHKIEKAQSYGKMILLNRKKPEMQQLWT